MASSSVSTKMISECLLRDGVLMAACAFGPVNSQPAGYRPAVFCWKQFNTSKRRRSVTKARPKPSLPAKFEEAEDLDAR
jgi:hypothetical protein